jgi:hypothetical protein
MIDADGPVHVHRADIRSVAEALLMVAPNEDFRLGVIALAHGLGVSVELYLELSPQPCLNLSKINSKRISDER